MIEGIAVNLRGKKKWLQGEGGDDISMVGKLRTAIKEPRTDRPRSDVVMMAISTAWAGQRQTPDEQGILDDDSTPPADDRHVAGGRRTRRHGGPHGRYERWRRRRIS